MAEKSGTATDAECSSSKRPCTAGSSLKRPARGCSWVSDSRRCRSCSGPTGRHLAPQRAGSRARRRPVPGGPSGSRPERAASSPRSAFARGACVAGARGFRPHGWAARAAGSAPWGPRVRSRLRSGRCCPRPPRTGGG